jgi:phage terminase small subunit
MTKALTHKQEQFALAIVEGATASEAYRAAYNAESMAETTVWREASRLMSNHKVATRVSQLKAVLDEKHLWTREQSVRKLVQILDESSPREQINAIKELNSMHGWKAPTKHEGELSLTVSTGVPSRGD